MAGRNRHNHMLSGNNIQGSTINAQMNHKRIKNRKNPKIPLILKTDDEDEDNDAVKSVKSAIKQKNTFQSSLCLFYSYSN